MTWRRGGIVPVLMMVFVVPLVSAADDSQRAQQLEARREQLRQKWERQFREADTDDSRGLTAAEIEAARLPRSLLRRFSEIDTDGDGALSPEEMLAAQERRMRSAIDAPTDAPEK